MSAQHDRKSALPRNSEIAARLRGGATIAQLGAEFGILPVSVRQRLNAAGWGQDGHPLRRGPSAGLLALLARLESQPWADKALCAQTDPEEFYPEVGNNAHRAKRVCDSCEVRAACLDYALETDQAWGVWGGLSTRERRRLKKAAS